MIENIHRLKNIIFDNISIFNLDLRGYCVLTEAATGYYMLTSLLAAAGRADETICICRTSRYGTASTITNDTIRLAKLLSIKGKLTFHSKKTKSLIRRADIITNLGFVRPINKRIISWMKPTAVIPLMWETWEYREEDLDLKECSTNGIMVLGTNESAKGVNGPEYMGLLCAKFLLTNGIEILNNKIILVSKGDIALGIIEALAGLGAQVLVVTKEPTITIKNHGGIKIGNSLRESRARELISGADALIVHSFPDPRVIIGSDGDISADQLQLIAPGISVFQLEGNIDRTDLKKSGISVFPRNDPSSMHMGWDLTELGPRPLIALNAAGLKVGEIMARSRRINDNLMAARKMSLENPLCQDFSIDQKEMYGLNRRSND